MPPLSTYPAIAIALWHRLPEPLGRSAMSQLQDPYRLLDIPLDSSPAHLKQAYKDLVFVWHPDRFSGNPRLQKKAEEKLKCINLAYQQIRANHRCQKASPQPYEPSPKQKTYTRGPEKTSRQKSHQRHKKRQARHSNKQETCVGITLQQVQFIVSHFHFRAIKQRDSHT